MGAWEDRDEYVAPQSERRSDPRYSVDEDSVVLFVGYGAPLQARLVDLSQEGCRLRTNPPVAARARLPVEVFFKINGISFRFRGVLQWSDGQGLLGIRFVNVVPRRMVELAQVICSMEEESEVGADAVNLLAAEQPVAEAPTRPDTEPLPARKPVGRERRQQTRLDVDTTATIYLVNVASRLQGRILDLSLSGCRIRTDEHFPVGIYTRVETEFRLQGLPFRLGGVIQAIHDRNTVGIRFLDVSQRKREQVLELIGEIEEMRAAHPVAAEDHA
ncbi:MAG TPA: PilZ domain-containing protein [Terracidiphilus sp.]|jgi:c-di-GMP-binding flagellar brake protein YcgR